MYWQGRFLVLLLAMVVARPALSADLPEGMISVRYAFTIVGQKPVSGESFCQIGKDCNLGFEFDPVMTILRLGKTSSADQLTIKCPRLARNCIFLGGPKVPDDLRAAGVTVYSIDELLDSVEVMRRGPRHFGRFFIQIRVRREAHEDMGVRQL